jgi:formylglycine-generating enzyme required for sulfatase activity
MQLGPSFLGVGFLASTALAGCQVVGGYEQFSESHSSKPSEEPQGQLCAEAIGYRHKTPGTYGADVFRGQTLLLVEDPYDDCFWMDEQESTVSDWRAWLSELDGNLPEWRAGVCDWKSDDTVLVNPDRWMETACLTTEESEDQYDPFNDAKPIRCVDWCEAEAFCRWNGKRLCYDANPNGVFEPVNKPREWPTACSGGSDPEFPFDVDTASRTCNFDQNEQGCIVTVDGTTCGPWEAGSRDACRPSDELPLDLGGNVTEWIDLCEREAGPDAKCQHRGGSYASGQDGVTCLARQALSRNLRSPMVGIRCCASLTPDEKAATTATR